MNDNHETHVSQRDSSVRYRNAYERARARQYMEQGMALADWSIRAWDGLCATLKGIGNLLHRTQRADDAVSYRG